MEKSIKKIVILGPESTGKSTLCKNLAAYYHSNWVQEYAREYLLKHGKKYSYEDLGEIALGQMAAEEKGYNLPVDSLSERQFNPLFIDTNLYVIKIWSEFVYNKCDNKILSEIARRNYDLYLLCNIDLPWMEDELREYPDLPTREKLFKYYKEELSEQAVPWAIISGSDEERLQNAIEKINSIFSV